MEEAAPIEAVEEVADALAEWVGASGVTFLIADFSGRAVVRLTTTASGTGGARARSGEHAETLPLPGTLYERVLRTQEVDVQENEGGARVVVPVTDRGDAIGTAEIVNHGHALPLRLRGGRAEEIPLEVDLPFGVSPGGTFQVQPFPLQPGDRIVLLTDGMQERNAASLDVAAALVDTADLHPREVVHALGDAVLHATGGNLRDDATMVCLDWYGGPRRRRNSRNGAHPGLASAARTDPGR